MKKLNTIINICPQGYNMVIERFGSYHRTKNSGLFFAFPLIEYIREVDVKEISHRIEPLHAISSDNVSMRVSGNLFFQFIDPVKACYSSQDPLYAVSNHAQSSMRDCIGSMELDEILSNRSKINKNIFDSIRDAADTWGMKINRYEITDISPDSEIIKSMNLQSQAERKRRGDILDAEGSKKAAQLLSEGTKIRLINESEGALIKARNDAESAKVLLIREAEGHYEAERLKAEAAKTAIEIVKSAVGSSELALVYLIAEKKINMDGRIGATSNTIFFNERPGDLNHLMAQVKSILSTSTSTNQGQDKNQGS